MADDDVFGWEDTMVGGAADDAWGEESGGSGSNGGNQDPGLSYGGFGDIGAEAAEEDWSVFGVVLPYSGYQLEMTEDVWEVLRRYAYMLRVHDAILVALSKYLTKSVKDVVSNVVEKYVDEILKNGGLNLESLKEELNNAMNWEFQVDGVKEEKGVLNFITEE